MNNYAIGLMRIQPSLQKMCDKTDKLLERVGSDAQTDTLRAIQRMEELIEQKYKLVNLSVICNTLTERLSADELLALRTVAEHGTLRDVAEQTGRSASGAARLFCATMSRCSRILMPFGIEQYADILDPYMTQRKKRKN